MTTQSVNYCPSCGAKLSDNVSFCPACGKPISATSAKPRGRFPSYLWILPILLGFVGGIIAGLVSALDYHDEWWQLVTLGFIMTGVWYLFWFLIFIFA